MKAASGACAGRGGLVGQGLEPDSARPVWCGPRRHQPAGACRRGGGLGRGVGQWPKGIDVGPVG